MFGEESPAAGQRNVNVLPAGDAMIGDNFLPTHRGPSTQQTHRTDRLLMGDARIFDVAAV